MFLFIFTKPPKKRIPRSYTRRGISHLNHLIERTIRITHSRMNPAIGTVTLISYVSS